MSARMTGFLIMSVLVLVSLYAAGCVSTTIGDTAYSPGDLFLTFIHDGAPSEGYVQVTVYRIQNNIQEEDETLYAPLALQPGTNTAHVNASFAPGTYKLYIYLIQNGERKAAVIRDLTVK